MSVGAQCRFEHVALGGVLDLDRFSEIETDGWLIVPPSMHLGSEGHVVPEKYYRQPTKMKWVLRQTHISRQESTPT
jgi:hypothetical protein